MLWLRYSGISEGLGAFLVYLIVYLRNSSITAVCIRYRSVSVVYVCSPCYSSVIKPMSLSPTMYRRCASDALILRHVR